MAYSVLEQLKEDALKCVLCFEVPGDDDTKNGFKQLRCNHIFCKNCLVKLVKPEGRITCPNCRDETVLDRTGSVDKLPSAFQVTNVIDWINKKQVKELKGQTTDRQCPEHKVQNHFFCIDCNEYVCGDCLALTHDKKHTSLYITAEAESMRKAIQEMVKEIDSQLIRWKKAEDQKNEIAGRIKADAANAEALLKEYTGRVMKVLESRTQSLMRAILMHKMSKLGAERREMGAIKQQIREIEFKMAKVRRSLKQPDDYDVFKERVAIGKIHKEVLANPPPILPPSQTSADSIKFSPNLIAVKRLENDIKRIGTVHTSDKSLILVRNKSSKEMSPVVLKCIESAVKLAYANTPKIQKRSQADDRITKCSIIVNHLQKQVFGKNWSCIIGDSLCFLQQQQTLSYAIFTVNDTDAVFVFKNMLNGNKNAAPHEDEITVQEDKKPKLKHQSARILHSSYNDEANDIALECVQRNLGANESFTTDTAFNIAQDFSARMKAPWQCIIHNDAIIGLSREHIQKMRSDTPSMVTVRVNGKDVWLLKMISFN